MAFAAATIPDLSRHSKALETVLSDIVKKAELHLTVSVESITNPSILGNSTDFVFTVRTTENEILLEQNGELPFQIRLKALLKTAVDGLPRCFPNFAWEVPHEGGGTFGAALAPKVKLTVKNLEDTITFTENAFLGDDGSLGRRPAGTRFRIRAVETLEARLARK